MATIMNLYAEYTFRHFDGVTKLPIVVVMHGFGGNVASFSDASLQRMADYGVFVVAVGMRGRNGADGSPDASGREIYDIHDAIEHVKSTRSGIVDPAHVCVCGYSGGGGNALAFACKFPDAAQYIVTHFGMSDYGNDAVNGWYQNGNSQGDLTTWVGGTPAEVPNAYYARDATAAIANFTGGHLWLFHDDEDTSVPVINSERISAAMLAAGLSNYTENYTDSGDGTRWLHGYPDDATPLVATEPIWLQAVADKTYPAWSVPTTGTVKVLGYMKTKRFEIWLGAGLDEVATVAYNTVAGTYLVTPLTGSVDVEITQGGLAASQTISTPTTITVA